MRRDVASVLRLFLLAQSAIGPEARHEGAPNVLVILRFPREGQSNTFFFLSF
jgi:hypothetical protein